MPFYLIVFHWKKEDTELKIISFTGICFILLCTSLYSQEFTLKLNIEKSEYLVGEPVWGYADLTNNSPSVKLHTFQGSDELELLFMDSTKTLLSRKVPWNPPMFYNPGGVNFESGETKTGFIRISRAVSTSPEYGISVWEHGSLLPGKYFLQLKFTYDNPVTKIKEQKEFFSNIVEFLVKEPQSEADKIVYKALVEGSKKHTHLLPYEKRKEYIDMFFDLVKKYPESGYFPSAYFNMFFVLSEEELGRMDNLIVDMFTKYPDSFMCSIAVIQYETLRNEVYRSKEFFEKINDKALKRIKGYEGFSERLKKIKEGLKQKE